MTTDLLHSGFAQRAPPLCVDSSLFHGAERSFLIGIVEPSPFPEIAGGRNGRHFRTPVSVEGRTVDPTGNVNPVDHIPDETYGVRGKEFAN